MNYTDYYYKLEEQPSTKMLLNEDMWGVILEDCVDIEGGCLKHLEYIACYDTEKYHPAKRLYRIPKNIEQAKNLLRLGFEDMDGAAVSKIMNAWEDYKWKTV